MGTISKREVMDMVPKMKCGKVTRLDCVSTEIINKGGKAVMEWMVKLCNV